MDGLSWKTLLKWMIWGTTIFGNIQKNYCQIFDLTISDISGFCSWNNINKCYPDLIRLSVFDEWRLPFSVSKWLLYFNFVLFDIVFNIVQQKNMPLMEEILQVVQDFFHQQSVVFSLQLHQDQHPKPWISSSKGFPVDPTTKGTYLQLVAREPQQRAAAVSWSAHTLGVIVRFFGVKEFI